MGPCSIYLSSSLQQWHHHTLCSCFDSTAKASYEMALASGVPEVAILLGEVFISSRFWGGRNLSARKNIIYHLCEVSLIMLLRYYSDYLQQSTRLLFLNSCQMDSKYWFCGGVVVNICEPVVASSVLVMKALIMKVHTASHTPQGESKHAGRCVHLYQQTGSDSCFFLLETDLL